MAEYYPHVSEPSDLAFSAEKQCLYTVSDRTDKVYKLSLTGKILKVLDFVGDDLEGVAYDSTDHTLWVAMEQARQLVQLDTNGTELQRITVSIRRGGDNSGLEGVCVDSASNLYVVNEKDPGLFVALDSDTVAETISLTFADDYSAICVNTEAKDCFWILSDEEQSLYNWSRPDSVLETFKLSFDKPEGVAWNAELKRFYFVSDYDEKLYVYDLVEDY